MGKGQQYPITQHPSGLNSEYSLEPGIANQCFSIVFARGSAPCNGSEKDSRITALLCGCAALSDSSDAHGIFRTMVRCCAHYRTNTDEISLTTMYHGSCHNVQCQIWPRCLIAREEENIAWYDSCMLFTPLKTFLMPHSIQWMMSYVKSTSPPLSIYTRLKMLSQSSNILFTSCSTDWYSKKRRKRFSHYKQNHIVTFRKKSK